MEYYPAGPAQGGPVGLVHGVHGHGAHGAHHAHHALHVRPAAHLAPAQAHDHRPVVDDVVYALIQDLQKADERETALLELSKRRESLQDLAPILWNSFGSVVALIQEIVSIYPQLAYPPNLTANMSNRVCNSLALMQCLASHGETRPLFLQAQIPLLLYPFLNTVSTDRPFEYLRLTSLGVIGALVKVDDPEVIHFLLRTEIIPLCLRIMENGSELSKTVATFIVQKLLLDEQGLIFVCHTPERFYAVATVLAKMVEVLVAAPSIRLLKHVVRCYLRLCDNAHAKEVLKQCLPDGLQSDPSLQRLPENILRALEEDHATKRWLVTLLNTLSYR